MDALNVADDIIKLVKARGVEGEVVLSKYESTSISQRLMKPEEMLKDSGNRVGIRVIVDGKKYSCISSNDLNRSSALVEAAINMAKLSPEDPYLSVSEEVGVYADSGGDLELFDDTTVEVDGIREILLDMEGAALEASDKVVNSEGASFSHTSSEVVLMTTKGFCGSYKKTYFSTSVSVVASDNNKMEVDYSFSVKSRFSDLEDPKSIGKDAARRALRRLNAREFKTCKIPVLFENRVASSLISNFASAINGSSIADKTSFLSDSMGKKLFSSDICIVDDPTMIGGISSRPFDGEGIVGKRKNVVENGILKSWILDMRTAKQLSLNTSGNACRSDNASVSPGVSNFFLLGSNNSVEGLMSDIKRGLYITDLFGFGVNLTTGDYSQGAFGFMIEDGVITYPVSGITVAGNLRDMFASAVPANDLVFLRSVNSPTLRFGDMVVSGVD
ncbi:TldD/PmbA family protein [Candidatus Anaplasma sp. TIGMIC]|uniref:TldD/PmbA family protein n=1 Tax=Candidatus Anaplasma sp. TIGMIC TaxID=3020713 RepID=UPI00232C6E86|nr:TldD/PmbA family protein [Candidatus Anaplasma sp. TIGMIC]MDB1135638.1 TldD/PmbA family protein [Candidatus Anaplasma sp. TIGMIC]